MIDEGLQSLTDTLIQAPPAERVLPPVRGRLFPWQRLALIAILGLSAFLECFQLDHEGYANTYYAAAVKSMLTSWHNFFFASFDSGGFVAVDKPPLGLWIQAASAWLSGFSGLSLLLPEAIAGVLSVALLYHLVARIFGREAGLLAAFVLALTPISVVTARNNTIDSLLVLVLLLAAWAVSRASETGRLRWLIACAVLVGLGFNIKMLQAYLVVPAFALPYLLSVPLRRRTRLSHLALALIVLLVVSFSWAVAVDLTPASQRPFVSDSGTNSELSLILGYNGFGRLSSALIAPLQGLHILNSTIDLNIAPAFAPEIGNPGLGRLLRPTLGSQVSWLLPLALFGLAAALIRMRPRLPLNQLNQRQQALLLWSTWLLTAGAYFSVARFFHLYYLVMLAPPIAALAGIGMRALWEDYHRADWRRWLLPVALATTAITQAVFLIAYPGWSRWLMPLLVGTCLLLAGGLIAPRLREPRNLPFSPRALTAAGVLALLIAPAAWGATSIAAGNGGTWLPQAGPSQSFSGVGGRRGFAATNGGQGGVFRRSQGGFAFGGGQGGFTFGGGQGAMTAAGARWDTLDPNLVQYLESNQGRTRFLVATMTSSDASVFMLATNQPAMALGGYQGWDRIVTPEQLAQFVGGGVVRFFYLPAASVATGRPGGQFGGSGNLGTVNNDLIQWVQQSCAPVSPALWQATPSSGRTAPNIDGNGSNGGPFGGFPGGGRGFGRGGGQQLYDCAAQPSPAQPASIV